MEICFILQKSPTKSDFGASEGFNKKWKKKKKGMEILKSHPRIEEILQGQSVRGDFLTNHPLLMLNSQGIDIQLTKGPFLLLILIIGEFRRN